VNLLNRAKSLVTMPKKVDVREEMKRRKSQRLQMLNAFKDRRELTTADLQRIGTGCSSRLRELRKDGHMIVSIYEKPGSWRYVYKGQAK
jgi:hypothetical protein